MDRDSDICLAVATALADAAGLGRIAKHHAPDDPSLTRGAPPRAKFIDLEAITTAGATLALEHTTIESYEKQRHDGRRLVTLLVPLENLLAGSLPTDRTFRLNVRRGAITDRALAAEQVQSDLIPWIVDTAPQLPAGSPASAPRHLAQTPPHLCVEAVLAAWPASDPPGGGRLVVGRFAEERSVLHTMRQERLRRAFDDKLPKLLAYPADRHVLVLEDVDLAESNVSEVWTALRAASEGLDLPDTIVVVETEGGLNLGTVVYDTGWLEDFTSHQFTLLSGGGSPRTS